MRVMFRICAHAWCIINGRVLMQHPEPGCLYNESLVPYLFAIFPERDLYTRPECFSKHIQPELKDWGNFDQLAFAKVW